MNLIANDLKEYDLQLLVRFHPLHMHTVDGKFVLTEKFAEEYTKLTQKYGELIQNMARLTQESSYQLTVKNRLILSLNIKCIHT